MSTTKTVIDVVINDINCERRINHQVEESALERCVQLLEHALECRAQRVCVAGAQCFRACRVLLHHRVCAKEHCAVCHQLKPLCHLHARRCQKQAKSCNMPFCPNGKELQHIVASSVHLVSNRTPGTPLTPSAELCVQAVRSQVKSADQCVSSGFKKRVTSTSCLPRHKNQSSSSLPPHHPALKGHLYEQQCFHSCCKMLTYRKETKPESILTWQAKVSIVPMK